MSRPVGASTLTSVGALLADSTRATVLVALMDGRARTAGELARHAQVAPSTVSEHLSRLVGAGFLAVVPQGRHRYFHIADEEIGRLLEAVGGLDIRDSRPISVPRAPDVLRFARTCYDHLAGELAVRLHDRLLAAHHVQRTEGNLSLTASGRTLLEELGAGSWSGVPQRPPVRSCLDWTERRDHLAGPAAAALFTSLLDRGWVRRGSRPRSLTVTERGRTGLHDLLEL